MIDWNPIDAPVDYVMLAGEPTPGLATIAGAGTPRRWEERGGYGLSGARVVFFGLKLAHFTITLRLYTLEDWAGWHAFKHLVAKPPLGARQKAIDAQHPILDECEIHALVVEDVHQHEQTDDGVWEIVIDCIEYRKLTPGLGEADGSKSTSTDPDDITMDAQGKQIDELWGE